jgi:hypothetical protein
MSLTMRFRRTGALIFVAACSGTPTTVIPTRTTTTRFDQALAYERGHGVPRDFNNAGRIYDQLCNHGDGELRACTKLLDIADRLESDQTQTRLRMCGRGDKSACGEKGIDLDKLPAQCAAGDVSACRFILGAMGLASSMSSSDRADAIRLDVARVSLRADEDLVFDATAEACSFLLAGICDPRGKNETHGWTACLDAQPASPELDAGRACYRGLVHACDAGSVSACEPLTGRMISSCDRCAAGDKRACGFSDAGENCKVAPERAQVSKECIDNPLAKGC